MYDRLGEPFIAYNKYFEKLSKYIPLVKDRFPHLINDTLYFQHNISDELKGYFPYIAIEDSYKGLKLIFPVSTSCIINFNSVYELDTFIDEKTKELYEICMNYLREEIIHIKNLETSIALLKL